MQQMILDIFMILFFGLLWYNVLMYWLLYWNINQNISLILTFLTSIIQMMVSDFIHIRFRSYMTIIYMCMGALMFNLILCSIILNAIYIVFIRI